MPWNDTVAALVEDPVLQKVLVGALAALEEKIMEEAFKPEEVDMEEEADDSDDEGDQTLAGLRDALMGNGMDLQAATGEEEEEEKFHDAESGKGAIQTKQSIDV